MSIKLYTSYICFKKGNFLPEALRQQTGMLCNCCARAYNRIALQLWWFQETSGAKLLEGDLAFYYTSVRT